MYASALQGFSNLNCCGFGVFQKSGQVQNSRKLVSSGTFLKVLITGTSYTVFEHRMGRVSEYSGGKLLASFDVLDDKSNEYVSG